MVPSGTGTPVDMDASPLNTTRFHRKGPLAGMKSAERTLHHMRIRDHVHPVTTMPPPSARVRMPDSRTTRLRRWRHPWHAQGILPKSREKDKKETSRGFPPRHP